MANEMDEAVERVARALFEAENFSRAYASEMDAWYAKARFHYYGLAEAAIKAMPSSAPVPHIYRISLLRHKQNGWATQ